MSCVCRGRGGAGAERGEQDQVTEGWVGQGRRELGLDFKPKARPLELLEEEVDMI